MRQREDFEFASALNNMAEGKMTAADVKLVKSRALATINDVPRDAIHLFTTNEEANKFNNQKLDEINTEEFISISTDIINSSTISNEDRNRIAAAVTNFIISETQGLSSKLRLKTSAKYMLTVNINTSDGLVNSATGELQHVDYILKNGVKVPTTLWILFVDVDVDVGKEARLQQRHPDQPRWTPIEKVTSTFQYKKMIRLE